MTCSRVNQTKKIYLNLQQQRLTRNDRPILTCIHAHRHVQYAEIEVHATQKRHTQTDTPSVQSHTDSRGHELLVCMYRRLRFYVLCQNGDTVSWTKTRALTSFQQCPLELRFNQQSLHAIVRISAETTINLSFSSLNQCIANAIYRKFC